MVPKMTEKLVFDHLSAAIQQNLGVTREVFDMTPAEAQQMLVLFAEDKVRRDQQEAEQARIAHEVEIAVENIRARSEPQRVGVYDTMPRRFNRQRDYFDLSSEFPDNEPNPALYLDGRVLGFRHETIHALEPRIRGMVNNAIELQSDHTRVQRSFYSYMMFHIWAGGQQRASTPIVTIFNNASDHIHAQMDELIEKLDTFMDRIRQENAGYEYIYEGDAFSYLHFYYCIVTFPEPRNHKQWGCVLPIESRRFFDIFTASHPDIECVQQCAERIALKDISLKHVVKCRTFDELVDCLGDRLCILNFHWSTKSINDVLDYTDLVLAKNSPWRSYNIIDTDKVYMIQFNGHVGLLENFKEQKRKRYYTTFRPLVKFPHCTKVTVCFDIECYFDPYNDQNHVPYLACCCLCYDDVPGNIVEFAQKDCVASMIDYIADICNQLGHDHVELIAHNGGGYDFHYILSSMPDPSIVTQILIRNNHFISFRFKHRNIEFRIKDSLHFLTCSLSKAAHSFLDEQDRKTSFPHHEILSEMDLQKEMKEWLSVETVVSANVEKERMFITSKEVITYAENGQSKRLIDWAVDYCRNDVIVLAKVWIAFKRITDNIFGCNIVDNTYTLAGMSFRLLEAFMPHEKLIHPPLDDFVHFRSSLIGGRCISLNGIYENIVCLDVKSLYPAAMALYPQPYGRYRKVSKRPHKELGIYYCHVTPVSTKHHGFFPLKYQGEVVYKSKSKDDQDQSYFAWYTTVDIDIGLAEGHAITYCTFDENHKYIGYSWKNSDTIFKDYIINVLYRLKLQYEKENDEEKRHVMKIIMNSLWGKLAQKWMDTQYKIMNEEDCITGDEAYKIWDTNHMLVKSHRTKIIADKPVQNGVFVLSWARYHMKQLWDACMLENAECIYSDTDSMFVRRNDIDQNATFLLDGQHVNVIGDAMGQLDLECVFDTFISVGKKQYIGKYSKHGNVAYKKRFKGVPQQYIKPDLFTHLLKSPNNNAQIEFLKFKREWGVVRGFVESKLVTQT